jgi:hypothetical protein
MRAGVPGAGLAFVVMLLRELLWIRSESSAGAWGVGRVFMEMKSPSADLEAPARQVGRPACGCKPLEGAA